MAKQRKPRWVVLGIVCGSQKAEKQGVYGHGGRSDLHTGGKEKDNVKVEGGEMGGVGNGRGAVSSQRENGSATVGGGAASPSVSSRDSSGTGVGGSGDGGGVKRRKFFGSVGLDAFEELADLSSSFAEVHTLVHPTLEGVGQKLEAMRPNLIYCFGASSTGTGRERGLLSFADGKVVPTESFASMFQGCMPDLVYLDACSSGRHAEAIRAKGIPHVVYWQSAVVSLIAADQFSRAFFATLRSHAVGAWDAFCVADASYRVNCKPASAGTSTVAMMSNGAVSGASQKLHGGGGGGGISQPGILGDPPPRPAVPHLPSIAEANAERRNKDGSMAVVLSPEVEVRVLLCGDSVLLDHVRLLALAEGLDALLTMEARGIRLLHRVSVSPPPTAASTIASTKGAFTMRCDVCTASGGRISLVMSGTAASFIEEQLLEYAIRKELVERSACVRVIAPLKSGATNRISNSVAFARRSEVVAAGGPVVEVRVAAPAWAVQLLRQLATESAFRGLVAMGVAGIGGTPVAAFQKEDASRHTRLCKFRKGEVHVSESNGSALHGCASGNSANGFYPSKSNERAPPLSWLRGPAPKRVRIGFQSNATGSGGMGELGGGGAVGNCEGDEKAGGAGPRVGDAPQTGAHSADEDDNGAHVQSKALNSVIKAAMRPIPQPGKRVMATMSVATGARFGIGSGGATTAGLDAADSPHGDGWGGTAVGGGIGKGAVTSSSGVSTSAGCGRGPGAHGSPSATGGAGARSGPSGGGGADGSIGGLASGGVGLGRAGMGLGRPQPMGVGPLLTFPSVKQHSCNRRPLHQCSEMEFIQDLVEFLCSRGQGRLIPAGGIGNFPDVILNGSRLDLFSLYREVVSRGGFHVGNGINWKGQVFARMRNHTLTNKMTGVGNTLKKHYETYLLEYELAHEDTVGDFCVLCRRGTEGDWVNCGVCGEWAHFECDKRPGLGAFKDYAKRDGRDYICPRCASAGEAYASSKRRGGHWESASVHGSRLDSSTGPAVGDQHEPKSSHRRGWGGSSVAATR